jgi:hypothetical protein
MEHNAFSFDQTATFEGAPVTKYDDDRGWNTDGYEIIEF